MRLSIYTPELADAILHAYRNVGDLQRLLFFGLEEHLANIVNPNAHLRQQVFEVLNWADGCGKVDRLFAAATQHNPGNPELRRIAGKIAKDILDEHEQIARSVRAQWIGDYNNPNADASRQIFATYKPAGGALEAFVVGTTGAPNQPSIASIGDWLQKLDESRRRVCKIFINGGPVGTGFLVASDRIMTNAHVVDSRMFANYHAIFDPTDTSSPSTVNGLEYRLTREDVRSAPRDYDYAIFTLNQIPDGNRGFHRLRDHAFTIREPVSVLEYQLGKLHTFTFGVIFDSNSFKGRVAYTANTAPGSSGSPVFADGWELVAMHHHGDANINNHGIPMHLILKDLRGNGKLNLISMA